MVESDLALSAPLADRLAERGYVVVVARDAVEGIELVHQLAPDLLIVDLANRASQGRAFILYCRSEILCAGVPIVGLVRPAGDERVAARLRLRAALRKSPDLWALTHLVETLLPPAGDEG